jgi:hypothetical protein
LLHLLVHVSILDDGFSLLAAHCLKMLIVSFLASKRRAGRDMTVSIRRAGRRFFLWRPSAALWRRGACLTINRAPHPVLSFV